MLVVFVLAPSNHQGEKVTKQQGTVDKGTNFPWQHLDGKESVLAARWCSAHSGGPNTTGAQTKFDVKCNVFGKQKKKRAPTVPRSVEIVYIIYIVQTAATLLLGSFAQRSAEMQ